MSTKDLEYFRELMAEAESKDNPDGIFDDFDIDEAKAKTEEGFMAVDSDTFLKKDLQNTGIKGFDESLPEMDDIFDGNKDEVEYEEDEVTDSDDEFLAAHYPEDEPEVDYRAMDMEMEPEEEEAPFDVFVDDDGNVYYGEDGIEGMEPESDEGFDYYDSDDTDALMEDDEEEEYMSDDEFYRKLSIDESATGDLLKSEPVTSGTTHAPVRTTSRYLSLIYLVNIIGEFDVPMSNAMRERLLEPGAYSSDESLFKRDFNMLIGVLKNVVGVV